MTELNNPGHNHGHIYTNLVTNVADAIGLRPFILRQAFRDGFLSRRTYSNAPAAIEATSFASLFVAVSALGLEAYEKHELTPIKVACYGAAGIALMGVRYFSNKVKAEAEAEALKIERYFKKEYEAVNTILGQGHVWKESDAHVLGRSLSYLAYYMKRNTNVLMFEKNFGSVVEKKNVQPPPIESSKQQKIGRLQEASDVSDENELRDDLVRGYAMMRLVEDMAFREHMMRRSGKTGRYYLHCNLTPIEDCMEKLGLLEPGEALYEASKKDMQQRPNLKLSLEKAPRSG